VEELLSSPLNLKSGLPVPNTPEYAGDGGALSMSDDPSSVRQ
jgi:hypothetical protein